MRNKTQRQRDLAKIHIAKKQLGLDDDTYRAMLFQVAGVSSPAKLTALGRARVLEHLHRSGFKAARRRRSGAPGSYPGRPGKVDRHLQLQKIEALLTIGGKPWKYAHKLALRICKTDRIEWVPDHKLYKIITALRKQAQREGWDLSGEM
ncbi:hypothetical protein DSCW_21170 [Desulfosarcina widdelii]|uniref:GemA protein n=1 Tax=Desulfosarcina widdelii TaxID=947919 RepID=A0A5K7Z217_9BACT|nr:regulatory protein GemA [Desulfosarcina widdelii]BBO74700.1 hypothetical protein DSCW_21170 [Desulfosarcina widdelii]